RLAAAPLRGDLRAIEARLHAGQRKLLRSFGVHLARAAATGAKGDGPLAVSLDEIRRRGETAQLGAHRADVDAQHGKPGAPALHHERARGKVKRRRQILSLYKQMEGSSETVSQRIAEALWHL